MPRALRSAPAPERAGVPPGLQDRHRSARGLRRPHQQPSSVRKRHTGREQAATPSRRYGETDDGHTGLGTARRHTTSPAARGKQKARRSHLETGRRSSGSGFSSFRGPAATPRTTYLLECCILRRRRRKRLVIHRVRPASVTESGFDEGPVARGVRESFDSNIRLNHGTGGEANAGVAIAARLTPGGSVARRAVVPPP